MTLATLPPWATTLLDEARVARLAFADGDDRPRVLPVSYAVAEGAIWSAIDRKPKLTPVPARVRWLRRRPEAALIVDVYDDDWERLAWVQVLGRVAVLDVSDEVAGPGIAALTTKYEQYAKDPPPGPALRLTPERALTWRP